MNAYQSRDDLRYVSTLLDLAPSEAKTFLAFNHAAERGDGAVPKKYRELIALAVALTTQCAYCLDVHTKAARAAGATGAELAETAFVAAAVRAGGSLGHALLALRLYQEGQGDAGADRPLEQLDIGGARQEEVRD